MSLVTETDHSSEGVDKEAKWNKAEKKIQRTKAAIQWCSLKAPNNDSKRAESSCKRSFLTELLPGSISKFEK